MSRINCRPAGESSDEDFDEFEDTDHNYVKRPLHHIVQQIDYQDMLTKEANAGNIDGVRLALSKGAKIVPVDYSYHYTPLMSACHGGYPDVVNLLLDYGADPNAKDKGLITPIMTVCFSYSRDEVKLLECLKALIARDACVDFRDEHGITALMYAIKNGHEELVTELLANNADINLADTAGWTALFWATDRGDLSLVRKLVDAGAKKNKRDIHNQTVFEMARTKKDMDIASLLCPSRLRREFNNRNRPVVPPDNSYDTFFANLPAMLDELLLDNSLPRTFVEGQQIPFTTFLTLTDNELEDLGIKLASHRSLARRYVLKYMTTPVIPFRSYLPKVPIKYRYNYSQLADLMMLLTAKVNITHSIMLCIDRALTDISEFKGSKRCLRRTAQRHVLYFKKLLIEMERFVEIVNRFDPTVVFESDHIGKQGKKKVSWGPSFGSLISIAVVCTALYIVKRKWF